MLSYKELELISCFRNNARDTLTKISKRTGVPISTIFDKLRKYQKDLIVKHTSLLDFNKLGFSVVVKSFIKLGRGQRKELTEFLMNNEHVNNMTAISNRYDFLVELVFKDLKELKEFTEKIDSFGIQEKEDFYVIEYLKKESFLTNARMLSFAK